MIQASNLSKSFGGRDLFDEASFCLSSGEKVGLVGRNGSGKSTLFNIIRGELTPDSGELSIPKAYRIGFLEQHIKFTEETVLKECEKALPEERKYDLYLAEKVLSGLGFEEDDFNKAPGEFSGGFQIRINLCKALLSGPNLLLLDEPTNYLDILSLRWLARFLRTFPGEVMLITHDRFFMDQVCDHTMGIHRGKIRKLKGDTAKFYEKLELDEEIYEKTRINQEKKREHLESFVTRFGAKANKAGQAQSKLKQLEKMENLEKLDTIASMGLRFQYDEAPGKVVASLKDVSFGFNEKPLFKQVDLHIGKRDRVGIIGKNGKGKSTLLNIISDELAPWSGEVEFHPKTKKAHFGQTNVSRLSMDCTVEEEIASANPSLGQSEVRGICGSLMFQGDDAKKKIKVLSGGEKNRVLLGKIVARPANLLLLDEPTNHLDMESVEILIDEIERFPGSVALVSHSEGLLRRVCNKFVVFRKGGVEVFEGSYQDFLDKIGWEDEEDASEGDRNPAQQLSKKERASQRREIIKERSKACSPLEKSIAQGESEIMELEEALEEAQSNMEKAVEEGDNEKILASSRKIGDIEKNIETIFSKLELDEKELQKQRDNFQERLDEIS